MKIKHRILIVDDDADDREIIRDAFYASDGQPECVFLENGEKLMQYLDSQSQDDMPSLILLDLNMPGKDGRESLKEIKSDDRFHHIPTVVFTTSSSYRDKQSAYDLGANCFVTKPDTFNKLTELTASIARLWLS
jgi:CheY-like chemotaxis protein